MTRFSALGDRVLLKLNMLEGLPPEKAVTTNPEDNVFADIAIYSVK